MVQEQLGTSRYLIRGFLGRGGMATVWLAEDTHTGNPVAVKSLKQEFAQNPEFRQRFRNEAAAARSVSSRNSVNIIDYLESAGACLIVMEYIRGESIADVLRRMGVIPEHLVIDVIDQAARGLSAVHAAGLVHRDIKPANMLVTPDGLVKITDFGIAKAAEDAALTRTGMVVGTAQYVSPEQARGDLVEPPSDVYSLGCVAYEMLCGHRPFTADSSVAVALAHINKAPAPLPATVNPHIRELIGIMLRKDPARRYADGAELAAAVRHVRDGHRPPQPAGWAPQVHRQTASARPATQELGQMTRPTGPQAPFPGAPEPGRPEAWPSQQPPVVVPRGTPPRQRPRRHKEPRTRSRLGCGCLFKLLILLFFLTVIAIVMLVIAARGSDLFSGLGYVISQMVRGHFDVLLDQALSYLPQWLGNQGVPGFGGSIDIPVDSYSPDVSSVPDAPQPDIPQPPEAPNFAPDQPQDAGGF
nr:serine/threonine-protein kinase [Corynebacterium sp. TAE3-ERU12]